MQIQLTAAQLQAFQMQLQGKQANQPLIIQTTQQQNDQIIGATQQQQQFATTQVKFLSHLLTLFLVLPFF